MVYNGMYVYHRYSYGVKRQDRGGTCVMRTIKEWKELDAAGGVTTVFELDVTASAWETCVLTSGGMGGQM